MDQDVGALRLSSDQLLVDPGEHLVMRDGRAAVSTQGSFSTRTALRILAKGGNAMDAAIAASLVDGVTNCFLTNHAGSVIGLFWHAASKTLTELNSTGVFPNDVSPCAPLPDVGHPLTADALTCCIPGFMPGLGAIHERFGTKPWAELCEDAIEWAEAGFPVSSFNYALHVRFLPITCHFPEGRELFLPNGVVPTVGTRFRNPRLAATLKRVAANGWKEFTEGEWAEHFVEAAQALGWNVQQRHMLQAVPRWCEPLRYTYGNVELVHLSPPQSHGIVAFLTLAIMRELAMACGDWSYADQLYFMAHALRWAHRDADYVNDPAIFATNAQNWMDPAYARAIARILAGARPHADLSAHAHLLWPRSEVLAAALRQTGADSRKSAPCGSCELSVVDQDGNWVQMMNTMQTGGIPGAVVDGVSMLGSHATFGTVAGHFATWCASGARPRFIVGSSMLLKDGKPILGVGTPGTPLFHVPQVLHNILSRQLDPAEAIRAPRIIAPVADDNSLVVEDRIPEDVLRELVRRGIRPRVAKPFDWEAGWFQCCWRDVERGTLCACTDPRGNGVAGVLV
jgi:gamma-glutamyltranspeptidase/glutathione hydrolase